MQKKAWPATGAVTDWDDSTPAGNTWEKANDPSPAGWRVPTRDEIKKLLDADKVSHEWTTQNGVTGRKFTDKTTGSSLFLPATGYRHHYDGTLYAAGEDGFCWSSTQSGSHYAYALTFISGDADWTNNVRYYGFSVRSVAE